MNKRSLITLIAFLLCGAQLCVAAMKIAYLDVDRVYNEFTEKKEAEEQFNKEVEGWETELGTMEQEIKRLHEELNNLPPIVTEERKEEKKALIEKKEREYYEAANDIRQRAMQRQIELLQPISEKIVGIINEIAEENSYDFVLNSKGGEIVLYAKDGLDISEQVISRLNEGK